MTTVPHARSEESIRRTCFFSSDSYGLAHVVRNARIASRSAAAHPELTGLVITGVATDSLPPLGDGYDYLKLPSILRLDDGEHRSVRLRLPFSTTRQLRSAVVRSAIGQFGPRVLVMDHLSRNIRSEIAEALECPEATERGEFRVLAFNDILNHPDVVRQRYVEEGLFDFAVRHFDEIWIYGTQSFYDWAREYDLSDPLVERLRYIGFLSDPPAPEAHEQAQAWAAAEYGGAGRPLVVVTGGGGHDAGPMFDCYFDAVAQGFLEDAFSVMVTGPLMPLEDQARAAARGARAGPDRVVVTPFEPEFDQLLAAADAVVTMGGCTLTEILAHGTPAVAVPRTRWPSSQQVRTELLAERGLLRSVDLSEIDPARLSAAALAAVADGRVDPGFSFDGLDTAAARLAELAEVQPVHP